MHILRLCFMTALIVSWNGYACADVLYSNVNAATFDFDQVSVVGPQADSFSTGSLPFSMTDVEMVLTATPSPGSVTVQLLNDASTNPGAVLSTIAVAGDNTLPNSPQVVDFVLATPYILAPNTRYWVELSTSNNSTAAWGFSFDTTGVGVANEFYANSLGVFPNIDGPYQMEVDGTALGQATVPEPSTLALFLVGLTCFVTKRGRRMRSQSSRMET